MLRMLRHEKGKDAKSSIKNKEMKRIDSKPEKGISFNGGKMDELQGDVGLRFVAK